MGECRGGWILLAGLLGACTSDEELLSPAQREVVAAYVTDAEPSPARRLDADLGERVTLLGYDVDQSTWRPGGNLVVTWYWKVKAPPGKAKRLFTRIDDPVTGRSLRQDGNGVLRWLFGPEHWRAAQYIRDEQTLHLPNDWSGGSATITVGFVDGAMVEAFSVPTSAAYAAPEATVPRVAVVRTRVAPTLDGILDDAVWRFAKSTGAFVETVHGGPGAPHASAKLAWDRRYLFVGVEVHDASLRASDSEHDSHLWEQDCVELMIDPGGDGADYFEIQASPRGVVFDTRYEDRRRPRPFGRVSWSSDARVGVFLRGDLDDHEPDAGYSLEVAIPWQAFRPAGSHRIPPAPGDEWRANLYVMDRTWEGQRAVAWAPLGVRDFHVPNRFGILAFEGAPENMLGKSEPSTMPPGRMPALLERAPSAAPNPTQTLIEKQEARRRLESTGGGH